MTDWEAIGDRVLQILASLRQHRTRFEAEARQRGITLDQLTAAAITGMLAQHLDTAHRTLVKARRRRA
jgi:hypothetical protein